MTKYKTYIGIDPDIEKSGVAVLDVATRSVRVATLPFFDALDVLADNAEGALVCIEAAWETKNWHYLPSDSRAVVSAKGLSIGRNQQVGIMFAQWCERAGIAYRLVKPLKKIWQGHGRKITQKEINQFMQLARTNQEGRDAALIAWCCAGLPILITKQTEWSNESK